MVQNQRNPNILFFVLTFLSFLFNLTSSFSPSDNYLLNCGSPFATTVDNRVFLADPDSHSSSSKIFLKDQNPSPDSSAIYHTAIIFTTPSSYRFHIKTKGTHLIRLHFSPFSSPSYNLSSAIFHVSALGFSLLREFSVPNKTHVVKDYIINVDREELVISFTPVCRSSFAFVNAIEVISAPKDLIANVAQWVGSEGVGSYEGLSDQALETVHRINVGGMKVTPFNDTLWRTWIPDENFLFLETYEGKAVSFGGRIKYQIGGATREIAPDNVYSTARVMKEANAAAPTSNITWVFPVSLGYRYLVRMHFCDIVSLAVNQLYFNVYLNGYLAYRDVDLSVLTNQMLAAPYYLDFVVDPVSSGVIHVTIGPSSLSSPSTINLILNGLEIMKISNSMGRFDGGFQQSWWGGNISVFLCSILGALAFMSVLLTAFTLVSRRWHLLKVSSGDNLEDGNPPPSGKSGYVKL
ncbi:hypothetical protein AAC387_Pa06g0511 [Persea americana]